MFRPLKLMKYLPTESLDHRDKRGCWLTHKLEKYPQGGLSKVSEAICGPEGYIWFWSRCGLE